MDRRDEVLALLLDELGIGVAELQTFRGRRCLQKAVYLVQHPPLNRDFGFRYNLYIRGPYSPELADAGYRIVAEQEGSKQVRRQVKLKEDFASQLRDLRRHFAGVQGASLDADLMEVAATLHFLWTHTFNGIAPAAARMDRVRTWIAQNKAELLGRVHEALQKVCALGMLPREVCAL